MIHTPVCDLLQIEHPIVLGGMAAGHTSAPLVAAVSHAGALGTIGLAGLPADAVRATLATLHDTVHKPFAANFLLFLAQDESFTAALEHPPAVLSFAWARPQQALAPYFERAHAAGAKVMYMAPSVPEAVRAAKAGADVIVAQGSEGGGHVGWMGTLPLVPMVIDAVAPLPVLAAGGIADGRGLAAALALGAQGVLLGTRFLATSEAPIPERFKAAIVQSDGHDTVLSEIPDVASGLVWPGAMARTARNGFIARWAGREWALREQQAQAAKQLAQARKDADADNAILYYGQDAGLIADIPPAGQVVQRMVEQAAAILGRRLPEALRQG
ncbi:MAG: nitronate monooxygenase [Candidatus Lambdaproteobacteria bacterium]|nr:nitronate monooxygenase [Candidatus Lambdaproteobacteria bacterium]